MEYNTVSEIKYCIKFLVLIRSYVGVFMNCYIRKSSIYPGPPHCLTIHHTCWPAFLAPISIHFLILMSLQKLTHINSMSCCLCNLMSTHKSSATAVLLQWTSDTNRTTHVHRCTVQTALWVVQMWCVMLLLQWFRGQVRNLVHVQLCQRGFTCSDTMATKNLGLPWGRGGYGIITICENKRGLYKTKYKEIVKFCVFRHSNIFSPSWAQIIRIFL